MVVLDDKKGTVRIVGVPRYGVMAEALKEANGGVVVYVGALLSGKTDLTSTSANASGSSAG